MEEEEIRQYGSLVSLWWLVLASWFQIQLAPDPAGTCAMAVARWSEGPLAAVPTANQ
jgi:hypothetical protein